MFETRYKNKIVHARIMFYMIGDMICVFPVLQELAKQAKQLYVEIDVRYSKMKEEKIKLMNYIFSWMPEKYNIKNINEMPNNVNPVLVEIGNVNQYINDYNNYNRHKMHVTQTHFKRVGLKVPNGPVRPELQIPYVKTKNYDYLLVPNAYTPQQSEQWPRENWVELVRSMPNKKFGLLGNKDTQKIKESNVDNIIGKPLIEVANIMRRSGPLISLVTGIGHLAYALGTPHILLTNQSDWSINPNALAIIKNRPIYFFPVKEMIKIINKIEKGETGIFIPADYNYRQEEYNERLAKLNEISGQYKL
jgi:ADP-heptose:LPS heptosyltransferase